MNDYIINVPQLQSPQKRIKGVVVWTICWLLWVYFLIPLITLSSWLLGDMSLTNEMRWFGGYKSLLELLEIYFSTLTALAVMWLSWVFYHSWRKQAIPKAANRIISDSELCDYYRVNKESLLVCRSDQLTTVFFDDFGQIIDLKPSVSSD